MSCMIYHVAGWKSHDLRDLEHVSWVGSVLYRSWIYAVQIRDLVYSGYLLHDLDHVSGWKSYDLHGLDHVF